MYANWKQHRPQTRDWLLTLTVYKFQQYLQFTGCLAVMMFSWRNPGFGLGCASGIYPAYPAGHQSNMSSNINTCTLIDRAMAGVSWWRGPIPYRALYNEHQSGIINLLLWWPPSPAIYATLSRGLNIHCDLEHRSPHGSWLISQRQWSGPLLMGSRGKDSQIEAWWRGYDDVVWCSELSIYRRLLSDVTVDHSSSSHSSCTM